MEILGGTPKKSPMNTIPFSPEMRTLAYVMIQNLYPVTYLTTLLAPRKMFLYDLFTHKEIDICGHIFHLLKRSTAHIKGSKTGMHTIPQDRVEDEGGDTEEEIERFTSAIEPSAQPSSSAPT